jgi:hypothetical protein
VAVFTEFRHSLEAVLPRIAPIRAVATLHGGQTAAERTRELGRFLEGSASVLLATDVASLGLNLQHRARWVISLELPWNPARLEQRLGRVDRIGQARPVHLTLLVARHDAEAAVLGRLARRTLAARRALGDDVLGAISPDAARVRASVITGAPLVEPAPETPRVPLCRRWIRIARAAARTLERRRQLGAHWRAPEPDHGRTRGATWRGRSNGSWRWPDGGRVLIFTVPIFEDAGSPLEEHVVAVHVPRHRATLDAGAAIIETARDLARRSLGRRAARVGQWRLARHRSDATWDRALSAALEAGARPRDAQPGLFDRRDVRAFEAARQTVSEMRDDANDRRADRDRTAHADVGRPLLAFILTRR